MHVSDLFRFRPVAGSTDPPKRTASGSHPTAQQIERGQAASSTQLQTTLYPRRENKLRRTRYAGHHLGSSNNRLLRIVDSLCEILRLGEVRHSRT